MPNIATKWILFGGAFIIATAGKSKELEINGQIRDREVRLIGADGEQKGVVSIQVAMRAAEDAGLDLVKIAPQAVPPVENALFISCFTVQPPRSARCATPSAASRSALRT